MFTTRSNFLQTVVQAGDTISNDQGPTSFATGATIPATYWAVASGLRVWARGVITAAATGQLVTLALNLGSTQLCTTQSSFISTRPVNRGWYANVLMACAVTGPSGLLEVQGTSNIILNSTSDLPMGMSNTAPISVDLSKDATLAYNASWGVADPNNSITQRILSVETIGTNNP